MLSRPRRSPVMMLLLTFLLTFVWAAAVDVYPSAKQGVYIHFGVRYWIRGTSVSFHLRMLAEDTPAVREARGGSTGHLQRLRFQVKPVRRGAWDHDTAHMYSFLDMSGGAIALRPEDHHMALRCIARDMAAGGVSHLVECKGTIFPFLLDFDGVVQGGGDHAADRAQRQLTERVLRDVVLRALRETFPGFYERPCMRGRLCLSGCWSEHAKGRKWSFHARCPPDIGPYVDSARGLAVRSRCVGILADLATSGVWCRVVHSPPWTTSECDAALDRHVYGASGLRPVSGGRVGHCKTTPCTACRSRHGARKQYCPSCGGRGYREDYRPYRLMLGLDGTGAVVDTSAYRGDSEASIYRCLRITSVRAPIGTAMTEPYHAPDPSSSPFHPPARPSLCNARRRLVPPPRKKRRVASNGRPGRPCVFDAVALTPKECEVLLRWLYQEYPRYYRSEVDRARVARVKKPRRASRGWVRIVDLVGQGTLWCPNRDTSRLARDVEHPNCHHSATNYLVFTRKRMNTAVTMQTRCRGSKPGLAGVPCDRWSSPARPVPDHVAVALFGPQEGFVGSGDSATQMLRADVSEGWLAQANRLRAQCGLAPVCRV